MIRQWNKIGMALIFLAGRSLAMDGRPERIEYHPAIEVSYFGMSHLLLVDPKLEQRARLTILDTVVRDAFRVFVSRNGFANSEQDRTDKAYLRVVHRLLQSISEEELQRHLYIHIASGAEFRFEKQTSSDKAFLVKWYDQFLAFKKLQQKATTGNSRTQGTN